MKIMECVKHAEKPMKVYMSNEKYHTTKYKVKHTRLVLVHGIPSKKADYFTWTTNMIHKLQLQLHLGKPYAWMNGITIEWSNYYKHHE